MILTDGDRKRYEGFYGKCPMFGQVRRCFICQDEHTIGYDAVEGYADNNCECAYCRFNETGYWPTAIAMTIPDEMLEPEINS